MKKIFLIGLACAGVLTLWGQGTLQQTAGSHIKIIGGAYLVLDNMHVVNNGSLQMAPGNGFVQFTGPMNVSLSGSGTTTFDEMLMAKLGPSTLSLQSDIGVVGKVNFSGGLIDLGNSVLNLGSTGIFTSESEFSRAFTTGVGYIQVSGNLNAPSSVNLGNLGAIITSTKNLGITTIRRGHQLQTNVGAAGNNSILRFYDIVPTNNMALKATLRFHYFDAELNSIPEATLHQWKSTNNINWDFVGADSRNTTTNYVERMNISKFERWTLATATAPTITCPANMTVSANMPGCKASVSFAATATGIPAPTIVYRIGTTVITSPHVFSKGTTTVTATASNGVAPNATCTFTVTVVCGPVTTTEAVTDTREVIITPLVVTARPNPSASYFTLNLSSGEQAPVSLRVVDVLGREVEQWKNIAPNGVLQLGHRYRPGIYFVQAAQGSRTVLLRLVKGSE
jgi:hypothetical protein